MTPDGSKGTDAFCFHRPCEKRAGSTQGFSILYCVKHLMITLIIFKRSFSKISVSFQNVVVNIVRYLVLIGCTSCIILLLLANLVCDCEAREPNGDDYRTEFLAKYPLEPG